MFFIERLLHNRTVYTKYSMSNSTFSFCMLCVAGVWLLARVALSVCLAGSADQCNCVCMLSVCTENHSQCNDLVFRVSVVFVKWVRAFSSLNHSQCHRTRGEELKLNVRERRHSCFSKTVFTLCAVVSAAWDNCSSSMWLLYFIHSYTKNADFLRSKLYSLYSTLSFGF